MTITMKNDHRNTKRCTLSQNFLKAEAFTCHKQSIEPKSPGTEATTCPKPEQQNNNKKKLMYYYYYYY